jgi:hypothetical protein
VNDWEPDTRPAPAELAEDYEAHRYNEADDWRKALMEPALTRLNRATLEELSMILGMRPIDTSVLNG